jgi:hypothetical protein
VTLAPAQPNRTSAPKGLGRPTAAHHIRLKRMLNGRGSWFIQVVVALFANARG